MRSDDALLLEMLLAIVGISRLPNCSDAGEANDYCSCDDVSKRPIRQVGCIRCWAPPPSRIGLRHLTLFLQVKDKPDTILNRSHRASAEMADLRIKYGLVECDEL